MADVGEKVKDDALQILDAFQVLPLLVVFDLDYTLWPFFCEDLSEHEIPSVYPHAMDILDALKERGIGVAIASRSPTADIAKTFLNKLGIQSILVAQEIFSSWTHKTEHFQSIHRRTGLPFNSMLFFDDEDRNIEAVSNMGVTSILVDDGVNLDALRQGLTEFSQSKVEKSMGDVEKVKNEALKILGMFHVLPRLVVFDLDYTLWPFFCEDLSKHEKPSVYPHAMGILYALKERGIDVAIASRSPTADIAKKFLNKLGTQSMLVAQEIFSTWTDKTEHFKSIDGRTGLPYNSMLLFDNEDTNDEEVSKMGVTSILVDGGVNLEVFEAGFNRVQSD